MLICVHPWLTSVFSVAHAINGKHTGRAIRPHSLERPASPMCARRATKLIVKLCHRDLNLHFLQLFDVAFRIRFCPSGLCSSFRWFTGNLSLIAAQHGFYARPSAHLPWLVTWAGIGTISRSSGIARFVQGGVVKTFRCATQSFDMDVSNIPTAKQGQYLAFIYYYTKLNRQPPAESDMQRYFGTTPPTVHNMVLTLCDRGFISREPGRGRTIRLLVGRDAIPDLE
ncbi:hypothetical protein RBSH_01395 [Rhodopirellula baltica SH28]|uniref:LexA repressor DNA-binding domain-containing protein n=2 Tax=Rhodopirellula baltica TaxID=265606 RepID=K5EBW0_RHOBT|nr:hypothetical protein RBSH_01395 [Rhodopirellula baltica SH28]